MFQKMFLIMVVCFTLLVTAQAVAEDKKISNEELISIATIAVKEKGFSLEDVRIVYDQDNKLWEENIGKIVISDNNPNYGILKKGFLKNYRTVYFDFKEPIKDIWVFIDKDTGEVLEVHRE